MKYRCRIARMKDTHSDSYIYVGPFPGDEDSVYDYPEKVSDLSEKDLMNLLVDSKDLFAREAIKYFIRGKIKCSVSDLCIKATELSKTKS